MKPLPLTVSVNPAPPAVAEAGLRLVVTGTGLFIALIVKLWALEVPPPGVVLNTVTWAVPTAAISPASIVAVNWVEDTYVVVRFAPFHRTTELGMKPLPLTVSVNPALPAVAKAGLRLSVAGTGLLPVAKIPKT
jgi:hypothetical protein